MTTPGDWNDFGVFTDEARISRTIFGSGAADHKLSDDIALFKTAIRELRTKIDATAPDNPCCGIPARLVAPVNQLLGTFFSDDNAYLDISCTNAATPNDRTPVPVDFPWGPASLNLTVPIIDGPAALGYILSAAEPPEGATFESYVVPLQAIYSRCLYLAYVTVVMSSPSPKEIADIPAVPWMSCSMYLNAGANDKLYFLLGSTYAMRYTGASAELDVSCTAKNRLMTRSRRQILNSALTLTYTPNLPTVPIPPLLEDDLIQAVWKMLLNQQLKKNNVTFDRIPTGWNVNAADAWVTVPPNAVTTGFTAGLATITGLWVAEHNPSVPPLILPYPREQLLAKACKQSQPLRNALREVVRARWTLPYFPTGDRIRNAFLAVFGIMYYPNMYYTLPSNPLMVNPQKEMKFTKVPASADTIRTAREATAATLWGACGGAVLDMLDRIYFWAETDPDNGLMHGGLGSKRFGRCAETYPVAGLAGGYITDRILQPNPTTVPPTVATPVRGISMSVREFNNDPTMAPTLAASFTKAALKTMHENTEGAGMYRQPCVNCQSLLPVFDVPVGAANYDLDATNWGIVWKH
ncbi:hypothetical protein B0T14DRAFT_561663 [Immersiella caudata]|uniref:Uncharacterized protein n=1 Tax=Immersiella caudata TaxID=314043 RepID=A0AA39XI82_9PEZI|nr:hypothetical protein B0T14DRAFT_561663 [Immersiella caudata]